MPNNANEKFLSPAGMKIFFSGIGGSGMSALAAFAAERGAHVFGSDREFDRQPDRAVFRMLAAKGVTMTPQDGSGMDESFNLAVFSTAVEPDNPDARRVAETGVRKILRPDFLAGIVNSHRSIAIAGTSGKSTISGMLAFVMHRLGLRPNFIGGGRVKQFRTESNPGNAITGQSDLLVAEACESDGSIVRYHPSIALISNLSLDHHKIEDTTVMFSMLAGQTRETIIINADDSCLRNVKTSGNVMTFGIDAPCDVRAENIAPDGFGTAFTVGGARLRISLPGIHNVYNALSVLAVLRALGVSPDQAATALAEFSGIERRFDIHLNENGRLVVDDYAHNPDKIAALMKTVAAMRENVCYVFQPHGFGPTRLMREGYIDTFSKHLRNGDRLFLLPILYAGGTTDMSISSEDLAGPIRERGRNAETVENREALIDKMNSSDTWIIFGARDDSLSELAASIAQKLRNITQ
jgi:UDP-N-acetylmuramate--alanine ligase